ncbi:hypothetical protein BC351_11670 [Paenibacillus ferrarius]|uniref:Uncharacterized protein n=1 Tax=Paenibacillus ferrarius TaxID=1469647 RepID=A0A1V4H829_9BACL|nr:hypothetical protein [Paenibacillus ferrarius]OPH47157.1 hypothetical protein BC351_11670 [Paenibacillus ferrarius]
MKRLVLIMFLLINIIIGVGLFISIPLILVWGIGLIPTIILLIIYVFSNHFIIRKQVKAKRYWIISMIIVFGYWILFISYSSYNSIHNVVISNSIAPNYTFIGNDSNIYYTIKSNKQSVSKSDIDYLIKKLGFRDSKFKNLKLLLDENDDGIDMFFSEKEMTVCRNLYNNDYCSRIDEKNDFICTSLVGGITNVCRAYSRGSSQTVINDFRLIFEKTRDLRESISLDIGSQMIDSRSGEVFNYLHILNHKKVDTEDISAIFQILPKRKARYLFSVNEGIEPNLEKNRNQYYIIFDLLGNKTTISNSDIHFFNFKE